jgi:hypothetical protein
MPLHCLVLVLTAAGRYCYSAAATSAGRVDRRRLLLTVYLAGVSGSRRAVRRDIDRDAKSLGRWLRH